MIDLMGKTIRTLLGKLLKIIGLMGSPGGQAEIYEARDTKTGRKYVVRRTRRASDLAMSILLSFFCKLEERRKSRPHVFRHILRLDDLAPQDGEYLTVWEMLEAGDLTGMLEQNPEGIPERTVVLIIKDVAFGLHQLQRIGWVHRDIKPENIALDLSSKTTIIDCGLVIPEGAETSGPAGTHGYISPNIWSGGRPDPSDDLFSLGVTAYQLLTGQLPFAKTKSPVEFEQVLQELERTNRHLRILRSKTSSATFELIDALIHPCDYRRLHAGTVYLASERIVLGL